MLGRSIRGYVPERMLLEGKDSPSCRVFAEDVALLCAEDAAQILASRGPDLPPGTSFWEAVPTSEEEKNFLFSMLRTHQRVLFRSERGAVLVFADVVFTAQRLLAVLPHWDPQEVAGAMLLLGRQEFAISSTLGSVCTACAPSEEACRSLAEMFFDVDRMFNNQRVRSFSDYCRLISEFGGCAPSRRPENPAPIPTTPREMDRVAMDYLEKCLGRK